MLTIELVPRTSWFTNLRSELSKESWDVLRRKSYQKASYHCEICGGQGDKWPVECHEIWNYNDEKKEQKLEGLTSLCPSCHEVKHIGYAEIRGRYQEALEHLAEVNEWTLEEAEKYIKEQVALWKERSKYDWTLDLSYLEKEGISVNRPNKTNQNSL